MEKGWRSDPCGSPLLCLLVLLTLSLRWTLIRRSLRIEQIKSHVDMQVNIFRSLKRTPLFQTIDGVVGSCEVEESECCFDHILETILNKLYLVGCSFGWSDTSLFCAVENEPLEDLQIYRKESYQTAAFTSSFETHRQFSRWKKEVILDNEMSEVLG